jgi:hypothetical protein
MTWHFIEHIDGWDFYRVLIGDNIYRLRVRVHEDGNLRIGTPDDWSFSYVDIDLEH